MNFKHFISSVIALVMMVPIITAWFFGLLYIESLPGRVTLYLWTSAAFGLWYCWVTMKIFVGGFNKPALRPDTELLKAEKPLKEMADQAEKRGLEFGELKGENMNLRDALGEAAVFLKLIPPDNGSQLTHHEEYQRIKKDLIAKITTLIERGK